MCKLLKAVAYSVSAVQVGDTVKRTNFREGAGGGETKHDSVRQKLIFFIQNVVF